MAFLVLLFVAQLMNNTESSSCHKRKFTETPTEVQNSCDNAENIWNRWRGELSYTWSETYIEVHWKKIVQDWACVKAMEFFVDGVKENDIWGRHNENVRINKIGKFSLTVEVYFLIPGTSGTCDGRECECFEATINLNVQEGNGGNFARTKVRDQVPGLPLFSNDADKGTSTDWGLPLEGAAASGRVVLLLTPMLMLMLTLAIYIVKQRRKERRRCEKAKGEEANSNECNRYGVYATSNHKSSLSSAAVP